MEIEWQSQLGQDRFVVAALEGKTHGTFVDIGAGDPKFISNTFVLETVFRWNGVLCDIEHAEQLERHRGWNSVVRDARTADWTSLLTKYARDGWLDYLSLDLEPPSLTLDVLKALPLDRFRFRIAHVEHDWYRDDNGHRRMVEMAARMYSFGYLYVGTAGMDDNGQHLPVEDWWIHKDANIKVPEPWAVKHNGDTK